MAKQPINIAVVFGTRPEAIKLAPVIKGLKRDPRFLCQICVTGQHKEMLLQALSVFDITPDVDLKLMQSNQSLADLTANAIRALQTYFEARRPDLVLVQGDTTTVFCAALAAFYNKISVAHVEAGLRTWNMQHPWPEEANRVLASRLAALHFAPTESAKNNLLREGVDEGKIFVTGNTVIDALFMTLDKVRKAPPSIQGLPSYLQPVNLTDGGSDKQKIVLITGHRRENFGQGFQGICESVKELAQTFPAVNFIYPVHLNPNVRAPVKEILGTDPHLRNVHLIEPLSYLEFVALLDKSYLVLTDSGGVQEEAPSLGKPVLVMRETTERPEAVEAGTVKLVGTDRSQIVSEVAGLLTNEHDYLQMSKAHNPYGDGKATERILSACASFEC